MRSLMTIAAARNVKWAIIPIFVLIALFMGQYQPKLQERSDNADQTVWLPGESESVEVIHRLEKTVGGQDEMLAIIVFGTRDGEPMSAAERTAVEVKIDHITHLSGTKNFAKAKTLMSPFAPGALERGQVSEDGSMVTALLPVAATSAPVLEPIVDDLREELDSGLPKNIATHVTGPLGLTVDSVKVFADIDGTLLMGTVILVLVLLLLIYRSPLIALLPLVAVALSYMVAVGLVYLADWEVNLQTTGILIVLMFGAGTDYCLLLVARYREELRKHESTHDAMRETLTHTTPAILSSGATVICATLVLLLADSDPTRSMGPVLALGIAVTMLGGLLLLPAMLLALGRRVFWPAIPRVGSVASERFNFWRRVGGLVDRNPVRALIIPVLILGVFALGNTISSPLLGFGSTDTFRTQPDSAKGFELMQRSFPAGELAPNTVIVEGDDVGEVQAASGELVARLGENDSVSRVGLDRATDDRSVQTLVLAMSGDPFSEKAADEIPALRKQVRAIADEHPGVEIKVGGPTAQSYDSNVAAERDDKLIIPLVLGVILLILIVLLRAIVAPLHLVASVVLSFLASLGLVKYLFDTVFDQPGTSAGFATLVFIFVVALGVDYNIFLISRIREESNRLGTRAGTLEGLATTGGIITSAGIILAGTFAVLASLPVLFLFQLGVAVALGVLLDTFVVRGFIVPSMMILLGDRNWWPRHPHPDSTSDDPRADAIADEREPALT